MSRRLSVSTGIAASGRTVYRTQPGQVWRALRATKRLARVVNVSPLPPVYGSGIWGRARLASLETGRRSRVAIVHAESGPDGYTLHTDPNEYAVFARANADADRELVEGGFVQGSDRVPDDRFALDVAVVALMWHARDACDLSPLFTVELVRRHA